MQRLYNPTGRKDLVGFFSQIFLSLPKNTGIHQIDHYFNEQSPHQAYNS